VNGTCDLHKNPTFYNRANLFPLVVIHRKIYLFLAEPAEPVTPPHFDPQHLTIVVQNLEGRGKKGVLVDDTANELFFRV
jgi:hypothetical protein